MRLKVAIAISFWGLLTLSSGCGLCPPSKIIERPNVDGSVVAASYHRRCGPVAPLRIMAGLRAKDTGRWTDVLELYEINLEVQLTWIAADKLRVVLECSAESSDECQPSRDRYWSIDGKRRWKHVQIEYELGPKLALWAPETVRASLPR